MKQSNQRIFSGLLLLKYKELSNTQKQFPLNIQTQKQILHRKNSYDSFFAQSRVRLFLNLECLFYLQITSLANTQLTHFTPGLRFT